MNATLSVLALAFVVPLSRPIPEDGEPCAGCLDTSAQPAIVNTCNPNQAGGVATLTHHSGACFLITGDCVQAAPCTPHLKVEVWTSYLCGSILQSTGYLGGTGLSGPRFTGTNGGPASPDVIYDDFVGVPCGSVGADAMAYNVGAQVHAMNCIFPPTLEGEVSAQGSLECSACCN